RRGGSVLLTDERGLALLDLGMVARITAEIKDRLLQLLLALADGKSEEAASAAMRIGEPLEDFDQSTIRRRLTELVGRQRDARAARIELGRIVLDVVRLSAECKIRVPPELTMLGKTLLNLDQVGTILDPQFDPNAAIRRHAATVMQQRLGKSVSQTSLLSSLIDVKDFTALLPRRLTKILDRLAESDI